MKEHPEIEQTPFGLHAVTAATKDTPPGVVFVLKNRSNSVNIDNQNRLHPYYMVYIQNNGDIVCDHLSPKEMLDKLRYLCRGKKKPLATLCKQFNDETQDGKKMTHISKLLGQAIASIIEVKEESDIDSFLGGGQISFATDIITGLDDFELICFFAIKATQIAIASCVFLMLQLHFTIRQSSSLAPSGALSEVLSVLPSLACTSVGFVGCTSSDSVVVKHFCNNHG